jgi:hypothetical protein
MIQDRTTTEVCPLWQCMHDATSEVFDIYVRLVCVGGTCMTVEGRELYIHWWWKRMYCRWLQMSFHLHLLISMCHPHSLFVIRGLACVALLFIWTIKMTKTDHCLLLESAGLLAVAMDCPVLWKLTILRIGLFNSHDTNIWTKNPHTIGLQAYQHVLTAVCGVM